MKVFDVAVFGGGVVGASVFNKLVRCGKSAVLLEKNDIASGASKANSGIVHAGFDATPGTYKADLNVRGSKMYEEICTRLGVPYKKLGAYVLGNDLEQICYLKMKGIANGLKENDLEILEHDQLKERIPNIKDDIYYGLYAKNSAIVNPYLITICLAEEAVLNGGVCETFFNTNSISWNGEYFEICGNNKTIFAKQIVNACGAGYNELAKLLGTEEYEIEFRRGEYYVLDNSEHNLVPTTTFPLPSKHSKGVLVTPTVDGNILVGPTSEISDNITKTTLNGLNDIKQKSATIISGVNLKKTIRVFSGIRTIVSDDFVIEKSKINNNVINIAGICSPGLSSAPAIAVDVINLLKIEDKEKKCKTLKPYKLAKDLSIDEYNELVKKDPRYGVVICKCEMITEGDIVFALHRPISVKTVDGIKRRVRAGMGRCQGGFCMDKVAKIIARENNMPESEVLKEFPNSEIFPYEINGGGVWQQMLL